MKILFIVFLISILPLQAQDNSTYRNPVIPGDFADPSVIRVGNTYYAAGTSSEWAPPYRLYQSDDLVNWNYKGPLFKDMPDWTMGSYWAPELYYRNGVYYAYYTARRKSDQKSFIGVATTRNINDGFTDHGVLIEWTNEAIDAFIIELDGKLYITWKAYGLDKDKDIEILGSELTSDGLKLKGDFFTMVRAEDGWEAGGIEGQCLVKHKDYIYMFYAGNSCCGRHCNYMTGVARAKNMKGPWVKYEGNPILMGDDHWRCSGHGTMVTTPDNRYFFLYHAYATATNVFTGRQGMLDEIIWSPSGWPIFRYGNTPSLQAQSPHKGTRQLITSGFSDHFDDKELHKEWFWDASQGKPELQISGGKLILPANQSTIGGFLGIRPRKDCYVLQASVESSGAGICLYGNGQHAVGLTFTDRKLDLWQVKQNQYSVLHSVPVSATSLTLYVETNFGQYCQFGFTTPDGKKQTIGNLIHINDLPQWDRPPMIGIHAKNTTKAVFDMVSLDYLTD